MLSRICSSNGSAVLLTRTPPAVTLCAPAAPAAWPISAAGSTCAPWVMARPAKVRNDRRCRAVAPRYALRASRSPPYRRRHHWRLGLARMARAYRCARPGATAGRPALTVDRTLGAGRTCGVGAVSPTGALTDWAMPGGVPRSGPPARERGRGLLRAWWAKGGRPITPRRRPVMIHRKRRGQARAKTAVTLTVTRWRPGETGTGEGVDDRAAPATGIGSGSTPPCSDTLTTGPTDLPSAFAYWAALVLASATALARAAASRELVSLKLSETPSTTVALPPARTASLIWVPAVASLRRVTSIDSLTPYPVGSAEFPA